MEMEGEIWAEAGSAEWWRKLRQEKTLKKSRSFPPYPVPFFTPFWRIQPRLTGEKTLYPFRTSSNQESYNSGKKKHHKFKIPNNLFKFPSLLFNLRAASKRLNYATQFHFWYHILCRRSFLLNNDIKASHEILFPQTNKQTCFFNFLFTLFVVKVYAKTTHPPTHPPHLYTHNNNNKHTCEAFEKK